MHLRILAILTEYVTAVLLEQPLTAALREVEAHLESCASCRAEAEALRSTLEALYGHEAVSFPEPPVPDLSFLRIPPTPPIALTSAASGIQSAVARIRDAIAIQFSEALLAFMHPPVLARAMGLRLRYAYTVPQISDDDPHITVEVLAPDEQDEEGIVQICVELPDADPFDQAGSTVFLETAEQSFRGETDHAGLVHFTDVPLDDVACWRIVIQPRPALAQ
ncbi:MAG: anti-sigma factor family protein [Chloroflexaceae bacterium]